MDKSSNRKIKVLEEINKQIVDNVPVSIIIIDKKGTIIFANKYFQSVAEDSGSPDGKNIFKIPFFIRENLCKNYKNLLTRGVSFNKENCRTRNLKGERKYISIVAVPVRNENGKVESALSMALDVTETVMARNKLESLNKNLENKIKERTREISKINETLSRSLASKIQFVSDASHELKTPLAIIKLSLYFAKKEIEEQKIKLPEVFGTIDREIDKVATILTDLNFLAKVENTREKFVISQVDLNRLMENVIKGLKVLADKKKVNIIYQKPRKNIVIKGDKNKLERLFSNILENAIKYNNEEGWVKISLTLDSETKNVNLNFSDNGIGISKSDLPYIFTRFYRAKLSRKTGEKGIGLGLTICRSIVEQHNGSISVQSHPGKGSVFTVGLPIDFEEGTK
ncbi:MAG: PAS domain-containing sensor histidine kinase [Candidatus Pacebacteria bacterium]|nr:PAS domain-containing sensor histidine kinase [Candidatus Paceibacterota bacterium]